MNVGGQLSMNIALFSFQFAFKNGLEGVGLFTASSGDSPMWRELENSETTMLHRTQWRMKNDWRAFCRCCF